MPTRVIMKYCGGCKNKKLELEFSKDYSRKDGLQSQCKKCKMAYQITYHKTLVGKESRKKSDKKQHLKFPEKKAAKGAVNHAIATSKLQQSIFCEECGLPAKTEGHHPDYDELLEVVWLCRSCHIKLHKNLVLV